MYNLLKNAVNLNPSQRGRAVHMLNVGAKKRKLPEREQQKFTAPTYQLQQYSVHSAEGLSASLAKPQYHKRQVPNALLSES